MNECERIIGWWSIGQMFSKNAALPFLPVLPLPPLGTSRYWARPAITLDQAADTMKKTAVNENHWHLLEFTSIVASVVRSLGASRVKKDPKLLFFVWFLALPPHDCSALMVTIVKQSQCCCLSVWRAKFWVGNGRSNSGSTCTRDQAAEDRADSQLNEIHWDLKLGFSRKLNQVLFKWNWFPQSAIINAWSKMFKS